MPMKSLHMVTWILIIIGALNWLLVGLFKWDIGHIFGGQDAVVSRIIYILVGLSAIYEIVYHRKNCKCCEMPNKMMGNKTPNTTPPPASNNSSAPMGQNMGQM